MYEVFITPASGVGGEWPQPARRNVSKKVADLYAKACEAIGQKARVAPVTQTLKRLLHL